MVWSLACVKMIGVKPRGMMTQCHILPRTCNMVANEITRLTWNGNKVSISHILTS